MDVYRQLVALGGHTMCLSYAGPDVYPDAEADHAAILRLWWVPDPTRGVAPFVRLEIGSESVVLTRRGVDQLASVILNWLRRSEI
jgi:hypothetical protein